MMAVDSDDRPSRHALTRYKETHSFDQFSDSKRFPKDYNFFQ